MGYRFRWPVCTYVGVSLINQIGELIPPDADHVQVLIATGASGWRGPLNERIRGLLLDLEVPRVRVRERDLSLLAGRALRNVNSQTNPRSCTQEGIVALARQSFVIGEGGA